jgi:hypothetical protein
MAGCNGTQRDATEHKTLVNSKLFGYKPVPLSSVECGETRLRIWGSGVRIPSERAINFQAAHQEGHKKASALLEFLKADALGSASPSEKMGSVGAEPP